MVFETCFKSKLIEENKGEEKKPRCCMCDEEGSLNNSIINICKCIACFCTVCATKSPRHQKKDYNILACPTCRSENAYIVDLKALAFVKENEIREVNCALFHFRMGSKQFNNNKEKYITLINKFRSIRLYGLINPQDNFFDIDDYTENELVGEVSRLEIKRKDIATKKIELKEYGLSSNLPDDPLMQVLKRSNAISNSNEIDQLLEENEILKKELTDLSSKFDQIFDIKSALQVTIDEKNEMIESKNNEINILQSKLDALTAREESTPKPSQIPVTAILSNENEDRIAMQTSVVSTNRKRGDSSNDDISTSESISSGESINLQPLKRQKMLLETTTNTALSVKENLYRVIPNDFHDNSKTIEVVDLITPPSSPIHEPNQKDARSEEEEHYYQPVVVQRGKIINFSLEKVESHISDNNSTLVSLQNEASPAVVYNENDHNLTNITSTNDRIFIPGRRLPEHLSNKLFEWMNCYKEKFNKKPSSQWYDQETIEQIVSNVPKTIHEVNKIIGMKNISEKYKIEFLATLYSFLKKNNIPYFFSKMKVPTIRPSLDWQDPIAYRSLILENLNNNVN